MLKRVPAMTIETLEEDMVFVEGGTFMMGSEDGLDMEKPVHRVQLDSFFMGRYPVTQALWQAVMGENPSEFPHPQRPVERVSWYDCVAFCNVLSKRHGYRLAYAIDRDRKDPDNQNNEDTVKWPVSLVPGANGYRLPTEAEWEYAGRGGRYAQPFAYPGSPNINEVAWWGRNSQSISQRVGIKRPNSLGLFDMSGNIREWVWEWYVNGHILSKSVNPHSPGLAETETGTFRGIRGGSWSINDPDSHQAIFRGYDHPHHHNGNNGFRLCQSQVTLCSFTLLSAT